MIKFLGWLLLFTICDFIIMSVLGFGEHALSGAVFMFSLPSALILLMLLKLTKIKAWLQQNN
ncbi:MAG: hypothetical protein HRT35_07285 [Algicola sp.]|nr:hypothetical protein [Algicola sp.]